MKQQLNEKATTISSLHKSCAVINFSDCARYGVIGLRLHRRVSPRENLSPTFFVTIENTILSYLIYLCVCGVIYRNSLTS